MEKCAEPIPMIAADDGWHELTTAKASAGSRYRFILPGGLYVPDPVSRFQPEDVNGASEVIDPLAYRWRRPDWKGRPWEEAVLYELHIGTFTPQGTFLAAVEKLDHLAALGITAIEIMAIADFPGDHNWGYDGVLLYAPDSTYGTPDDLKTLIDAAHQHGLMVILDVVYNHFGPEGNYLPQYFPDIATKRYSTPWGQALNFDSRHCERTREFIIHNALYWIEEFRVDGLRLDAVHAIIDTSSTHILDELAQRVRELATDRHVHLVLESDDTMWNHLIRDEVSAPLLSTAQWNHDCKQLSILGLSDGRAPEQDTENTGLLGRALTHGFTSSPPRIWPSREDGSMQSVAGFPEHLPPTGFIAFLQSHDLVGNRLRGERITDLARPQVVRALTAIYLLSPQIPMLFMGEEWAATSPFPYFCDFKGKLAEAVRQGRLEQFASPEQRQSPEFLATVPDPVAKQTFLSAKLNWAEIPLDPHSSWLCFYRCILQARHRKIIPLLTNFPENAGSYEVLGPRSLQVVWRLDRGELRLDANLSDGPSAPFPPLNGETIWLEGSMLNEAQLAAWSVRWSFTRRSTTA